MDKIVELIATLDLHQLLTGVPIDVSKYSKDELNIFIVLAAHCIFNGPVSIHKDTIFPLGVKGKIEDLIPPADPFKNSNWRATVLPISRIINADKRFDLIKTNCTQVRLYSKLWPL